MNKIDFPVRFDDGSDFEGFLPSPVSANEGVVATSSKEGTNLVLRLYKADKSVDDDTFKLTGELAAFSFNGKDQMDEFMRDLPKISGIDMLILLNPSY